MSTTEFGQMIEDAMREKGLSQNRLGYMIGILPDGRVFNATQIRHMLQGTRRYYDTDLVARLVEVLGLDPAEAYPLAGVWPPDLPAQEYRAYRHRSARKAKPVTSINAARSGSDQGKTLDVDSMLCAGQPRLLCRGLAVAA